LESFLTRSLIRLGSMLDSTFRFSVTEKRVFEKGSDHTGFRYLVLDP